MERVTFSRSETADLATHFMALSDRIPLQPIRSQSDYDAAIGVLDGLLDAGAGAEDHPLAPLLGLLGEFVAAYESERHRLPDMPAAALLRFLMQQHGLRQNDLPEIGSQGVVSEILRGKRELNKGQIERLSARFAVSPASFFRPREPQHGTAAERSQKG